MFRFTIYRYYNSIFLIPSIVLNYDYEDKIVNINIMILDYIICLTLYFKNNETIKN